MPYADVISPQNTWTYQPQKGLEKLVSLEKQQLPQGVENFHLKFTMTPVIGVPF